jgi:hypothetical protein
MDTQVSSFGYLRLRGYRAVVRAINCLADSNKTGTARDFTFARLGVGGCAGQAQPTRGLGFGRLDNIVCRTQSGLAHVASHRAPAVAYYAAGAPHFWSAACAYDPGSVTARSDGSIHFAGTTMELPGA